MNDHDLILLLFLAGTVVSLGLFVRMVRRRAGQPPRLAALLAGNALLLAGLIFGATSGGEIYYRFFCDSTDGYDLDLVTSRWLERHYELNDAGVRDDVDYAGDGPGVERLTILGDSYTNGHGLTDVADRFANRLRASRPERQVHLVATDGLDTGPLLERLERKLAAGYRLDVVLYAYCLNDLSDLIPAWQSAAQRIYNEKPAWPFRASFFLNTWYYRYRIAFDEELAGYFDIIEAAYRGSEWDRQRSRLDRLQELVRAHGGRLAVVTFPFFEKMDSEGYRAIHEQLDRYWREQAVPHRDLWELFEGAPMEDWVVSIYDTHPNAEAHRRTAEAIEDLLQRLPERNASSSR